MKAERRWHESYGYHELRTEVVDVVTFAVHPGGIPVSDNYGVRPGHFTSPETMAVVIRPTGQYMSCPVSELWRKDE